MSAADDSHHQTTHQTSHPPLEVVEKAKAQVKLHPIACLLCITSAAIASPTTGTLVAVRNLNTHEGVSYSAILKGGEETSIEVNGNKAGGDLDCSLYKFADWSLVAQDKNKGVDSCHMKAAIKTTGTYVLIIVNNGPSKDVLTMVLQ